MRQTWGFLGRCCHQRPASRFSTVLSKPWQRLQTASLSTAPGAPRSGALQNLLKVSDEVADALATNKPVVALETTIYTHGAMSDSLDLEDIVRKNGAVPAVVGVLEGVPTVGLLPDEVAHMTNNFPRKVSRRDMAYLVGMGMLGHKINGGTTVAGTMILARLAGIRVFGTGGLGGVHRDGHVTFDISADLTELGRTRMAVISSGCKGFLDLPRTLEYLETQGVHVSTFADGRKGAVDFPAFWARESGVKSPSVVQTEEEAAAMILAQERLNIESGLLFANPIPAQASIPKEEMNVIIEQAVSESREQGASGNENTPFILRRIRELTDGRSVPANLALVRANVERAAKIAVATSRLIADGVEFSNKSDTALHAVPYTIKSHDIGKPAVAKKPSASLIILTHGQTDATADVLVAGSVAVDLSCNYAGPDGASNQSPHFHTSNPATIKQSIGGVGRNVALAAHRVSGDLQVRLCSIVGNDIAGSTVIRSLEAAGMDTSCVRQLSDPTYRTAQYVAVNDGEKSLVMAMADMDIFTTHFDTAHWETIVAASKPKWMVVDGNWAAADIRSWINMAKQNGASIGFEPVSNAKSARLFCPQGGLESLGVYPSPSVNLATPNQYELAAMHAAATDNGYLEDPRWWEIVDAFGMRGAREKFVQITSADLTNAGIPQQAVQLLPYIPTILTKMGDQGALLTEILAKDDPRLADPAHKPFVVSRSGIGGSSVGGIYMRLFPVAQAVQNVVSVNGVGDTFLGVLVAGLAQGGKVESLISVAQKAAVLTLKSAESVSEDLGSLKAELAAASQK